MGVVVPHIPAMTPEQSRAARGWLDRGQQELATAAGVGLSTVRDCEKEGAFRSRIPIEGTYAHSDNGSHGMRNGDGSGGGEEPSNPHHPSIAGPIEEPPSTGKPWSPAKQELWLQTARSIFRMIYPTPNDEAEAAH